MRQTLIQQVNANCEIGNAGQAGYFSLCGLLLRLRQLYKWEHGLPPWQEPDPQPVLDWVADKEQVWEQLEGASWRCLDWQGAAVDPFAVADLNCSLIPQGLAYGAGYSRGLAPTCFLGELVEVRQLEDLTVLVLGAELARDLDATPALTQGSLIYARKQALAFFFWDRLSDPAQQDKPLVQVALAAVGATLPALLRDPAGHREALEALAAGQLEAAIRHEVGEAREPGLREALRTTVALFPQTRIELWVRTLKDALADVNDWGRLAHLIAARDVASLALMLAWQPGLYALLLPELEPAFWQLQAGAGWEGLEAARQRALLRLRTTAAAFSALVAASEAVPGPQLRQAIEARFLQPLGL